MDAMNINPDQRLSVKEVAKLLDIGVSTTWKYVARGLLTPPQKLGQRCSRFRYGTVLEDVKRLNNGEGR